MHRKPEIPEIGAASSNTFSKFSDVARSPADSADARVTFTGDYWLAW